jgi:stearoyl-CoA desaturase (delta-9 desaturase)
MHWLVGYLCHTDGTQDWLVDDGAVQARNVAWAAFPSMGESWHNNHHAFPASARHGIYPGQWDMGFHFIKLLAALGLASNVRTAEMLPLRAGITAVSVRAERTLAMQQANQAMI